MEAESTGVVAMESLEERSKILRREHHWSFDSLRSRIDWMALQRGNHGERGMTDASC